MEPIVIVGFGTGAIGAVRAIIAKSRETDVVVVERRDFDTYSPCGMPYVVEGIAEHHALKHEFPGGARLRKLLGTEAVFVDRKEKKLGIRDGGGERSISYSSLILDTGSRPLVPPVPFDPGLLGNGVYTFGKPGDVDMILGALADMERVVVVGAGAIGLELAQAFAHRKKQVVLLDMLPQPMYNSFDPDMAKLAVEALPTGIETHFSTPMENIMGQERVTGVVAGSMEFHADAVVLCAGVVPETGLAEKAGLETSKLGIVVDNNMRTSDPDIYAVGDCIQGMCRITGGPTASRIAPPALHQGRVAGLNAIGVETVYNGSTGAFVTVIGDVEFASAGLKSSDGHGLQSAKMTVGHRPDYMGARDVVLKMVSDENGRLLGAQACGPGAASIVNRLVVAISAGMTVQELGECEFAYCPPVNDIFDPVTITSEALARKLARRRK